MIQEEKSPKNNPQTTPQKKYSMKNIYCKKKSHTHNIKTFIANNGAMLQTVTTEKNMTNLHHSERQVTIGDS